MGRRGGRGDRLNEPSPIPTTTCPKPKCLEDEGYHGAAEGGGEKSTDLPDALATAPAKNPREMLPMESPAKETNKHDTINNAEDAVAAAQRLVREAAAADTEATASGKEGGTSRGSTEDDYATAVQSRHPA